MKKLITLTFILSSMIVASFAVLHADDTIHKVAIHVDSNDPKVMNLALNNVANVRKYSRTR